MATSNKTSGAGQTGATTERQLEAERLRSLFERMLESAEDILGAGKIDRPGSHLGLTPLAWACHRLDPRSAKRLLALGASPQAKSADGRTPMELVARAMIEGEERFELGRWQACVEMLLGAGIDVNEQPCLIECGVVACRMREPWILEWLLSKGAKASASKEQEELLAAALRHGTTDAVRLLLIAGVDVSGIDVSGEARAGEPGGLMVKRAQDVAAERKLLNKETPQAPALRPPPRL